MDLEKRIEELEAQVRALTSQLQHAATTPTSIAPTGTELQKESLGDRLLGEHSPAKILDDMKRNVGRALGGEPEDSLEDRIGSIWLSRVFAVVFMTGMALGAARAFGADSLHAWHKVGIGYLASVAAIGFGLFLGRGRRDFFAQTILGTGLAGLYFTTYASFFLEQVRIYSTTSLALPALLVALMILVGVIHWQRNQTTAGVALFLVYYTVVVSCTGERSASSITYAFFTCAVLCIVALAFHAAHRWLFFTWASFIATYLTYILFLWSKPGEFELSDKEYFWLSNGFLALCYTLFSVACVIDAQKRGEYRRMVAPLAGTNSAVFFTLTWFSIRTHYFEEEWMFRLGFAVMLTMLAVFAETSGPRRNYLFQIFVAKAVIMYTLTLQSLLSGEMLLLAMAIECLGLIFSYQRSGIVAFKVLNLALMVIVLIGCLISVRMGGTTEVGDFLIRKNWLCCVGVPIIFAVCAWYYEKFVRRIRPQHRTVSGQWFLADSVFDVPSATASMMHAASASLILLSVTILDQGENITLPYLLAGEAVIMAVVGLLMRTPQVDTASVLLLVASHATYYFFLWLGKPGFEDQMWYVPLTIAVALLTYCGAFLWERYLYRYQGGKPWEHDVVAAVPYLIATTLLATLSGRTMDWMNAPLTQNGIGVVLLLIGCVIHYTGLKTSGVAAIAIGTYTYFARLFDPANPLAAHTSYIPYFILFLFTFCAAEREFAVLQRQERIASKAEDAVRTALVIVLNVVGLFGLYQVQDNRFLPLMWGGLAVSGMALGALFRESRYRWAAFVVFGFAIVRAFWHEFHGVDIVYQLLGLGLLGLIVSWAYSRYRSRSRRRSEGANKAAGNG